LEWPVTPRPGQREAAEQLAELVEQGRRVLFSAPVGWGKTHAVIAALVQAKALPALWLARTLTLGARVAEDAALWKLHTFTAAGRERACPLAEEKGDSVHDFCRYYRHKCPYARLPPSPPAASDWKELKERGEREGWCPYFAQDFAEADVVVQSYYRRRRPARAVVIDEAHNLLTPEEREFTIGRLAEAVAAARERGASERLQRALNSLLRYALIKDGDLDVSLFISEEGADELRKLYFAALEEGDRRLKILVDLTRAAAVYVEGERVRVYRPPLPLPHRPAIFVSATMPREAAQFLQTEVEIRIPWRARARARIVQDVSTKYEEYDSQMALRYKKLLMDVAKQHKRVLVFAASERVARDLRAWVQYEECVPPDDWEGVLLLRARGRFAEGVDLPAPAIMMAGAPYLPPDISSRLAQMYKRTGHPDPVKAAIDVPMIVATLQCVGRAWRDPQQPPVVYLADWRYKKYTDALSEYLDFA
jgi:DNA excision repair protein ERCC-2